MLQKILFYSFAALFAAVPLIWSPLNFELFEFNKMLLVYLLTTVIIGVWLLKSINQKSFIINRTPLDLPLLLFLGANILSTVFSIDRHTSIWGYYSRLNGGLLSLISYLLLYWALVSNLNKSEVIKLLKIGLISGFIVSLWGILEHFGVSLSCVLLNGNFNADCWVQDVQARVFATLGQPNWMASYLGMLIFPSIYFALTAKTQKLVIGYWLLVIGIYLAFTFTYSRGGLAGVLAGLVVFMVGYLFCHPEAKGRRIWKNIFFTTFRMTGLGGILLSFLLINILFGSALTRINLTDLFPKSSPVVTEGKAPSAITQLEAGGTESWQIRLIVWQGAVDIFKAYPILGSGVETFAYSYYQFRPVTANLNSEWDFLYNKAHNEFLNYLATTGLLGFGTYLVLVGTFIWWNIKRFINSKLDLLTTALLAGYISYLISNLVGFSVVITALFFFLFPSIAFVTTDSVKPLKLKLNLPTKVSKFVLLLITFYLLLSIIRIWYADTIFAIGQRASSGGNIGKAYDYFTTAVSLRGDEPFYISERSNAAASSALSLKDIDATLSGTLKDMASLETEQILKNHPKNTSFFRTAIRTYYDLSLLDSDFNEKLLQTFDATIKLAPTDPKLLYNKAIVLGTLDRNDEAIATLNKAIELKPNYTDAYFALGLFYFDGGDHIKAVENMRSVLKIAPLDTDALDKLNDWGQKGIATSSGTQ
jgi:putative inorganic carbon (hco3(-)) transporter